MTVAQNRSFSVRPFLESEVVSMLNRLEQVQPFALSMPMVAAARVSDKAIEQVNQHIETHSYNLRQRLLGFSHFLKNAPRTAEAETTDAAALQGQFAVLKLRFNAILDQFDIFADVVSQRAEHKTGVWIAGLDTVALDALRLGGNFYDIPPVMCFLERGHGAAIRKARTRLPGGDENPVAIIQVPRERMVGSGIAASLIHEVGHQGAALLDLVGTIRVDIDKKAAHAPPQYKKAWQLLSRWISEIIADFWAMAHLGIGATLGLMSVVSLPHYFMFRIRDDDPHPVPFIRVRLSLAFGERLFPDPQWQVLSRLWATLYPTDKLDAETRQTLSALESCMPDFVELVINHKNQRIRGQPLATIFEIQKRQPQQLRQFFKEWAKSSPLSIATKIEQNIAPSLAFAIIGQAKADGLISAEAECRQLGRLLREWAIHRI